MKQILVYIAALVLVAVLAGSCTRTPARYAVTLADADSLAECGRADSVRRLLARIPTDSLSRADKALLYLLLVKTNDKAFLTHTSADTIRMALDYFGSRGPKLRRAEARYYEARVLTDLKDYAPALDAYDEALAILGYDTTRAAIHLKDLIFSQNAQLLTSLHLYSEAIPFYQDAISISISNGDYPGAVLDIMDCVFCMMQLDNIDSAEAMLAGTDSLLPRLAPSTCAEIDISRRDLLRARGQYSEAVSGIDTVLAAIEPRFRDFGYRVAADAFHSLGNRDSSDKYINLWLQMPPAQNKSKAYRMLTENAIASCDFQRADSLFSEYVSLIHGQLNIPSEGSGTMTEYLSRAHKSETLVKILRNKNRILYIGLGLLLIIIITIVSIFLNIRLSKELKARWILLEWIKNQSSPKPSEQANSIQLLSASSSSLPLTPYASLTIREIRANLIDEIIRAMETSVQTTSLIMETPLCFSIKNMAAQKKSIPHKSEIWEQLHDLISSDAPAFFSNLTILLRKHHELRFRICMLIYAGFEPKEISVLLAKNLSGITYHRKEICHDAFDNRIGLGDLPNAICNIPSH